jgi:hypothetical protein
MLRFRLAVAVGGLVPVLAGAGGVLAGPAMLGSGSGADEDSHFRYLSGLLLGIGLGFWSTLGDPVRHTRRFRLLTAIVVLGGLGRLFGLMVRGVPGTPMLAALGMELVVTPLLCLWQARLAR